MFIPISSIPIGPITCIPTIGSSAISISIIFSSKSPNCNFLRILALVLSFLAFILFKSGCSFFSSSEGNKISTILSFARCSASSITSSYFSRSTNDIEVSIKSRTIDSTSRPTYPTSVNLLASTLMNGAFANAEILRAISVLPTPVDPIMIMLLGIISFFNFPLICFLRQRFRSAMATAFLAFS